MVSFSCEACNDTLTKKKLDGHLGRCRGPFTCLDCNTTFQGTSYRAHTSCISEDQKYQGALYRPQKQKGKKNTQPIPATTATAETPADTIVADKAMEDLVQIGNGTKEIEPVPITNSEPADDEKEGLKKEKKHKKEKKEAENISKKRKAKDSESVLEDLEKVQEDTVITEATEAPAVETITDETTTPELTSHQKKRQKKKEKNKKVAEVTQEHTDESKPDVAMADAPVTIAPTEETLDKTETTAVNETETPSEKKKKRGAKKNKKNKDKLSATTNDDAVESTKETNDEIKAKAEAPATTIEAKKDKKSQNKETQKPESSGVIESYMSKNSINGSVNLQTIFAKLPKAEKARLLEQIMVQKSGDDGKIVLEYSS